MNGDANRAAGVESADSGSSADYPAGNGSPPLDRARDAVEQAKEALRYLNRQEVEIARVWLAQAEEFLSRAAREG